MNKDLPEVVYIPESQLRKPGRLFKSMWQDLLASRELAWRLFVRNISAMYRQTLLGYVWAFLPPIATTLVWVFLNSQKILNIDDTGIPYPAYVLTGTLLWQAFVDALNSPLKLVTSSKAMLAKINFPREALILAGLGEVLFNFAIRLVLLVCVFIWFNISVPSTIFLAPLGILALMALGLMVGLFLTPFGLLYQDIQQGIVIIIQFWFFLTPIIYSQPTTWPASLLASLNPVSPLLVTTRQWLTTGHVEQLGGFCIVTGVTFIMMLTGWLLYRLTMPHLIPRMSS